MENEFFLISTTTNSLDFGEDKMLELLKMPEAKNCCYNSFGNNFYPVIGIDYAGNIKCLCSEDDILFDLVALIIPDTENLDYNNDNENQFLKFVGKKIEECDKFYVLLHSGEGSLYDAHERKILEIAKENKKKIRIARSHHTQSRSQNPKHALGDGLEMVAKTIMANPIDIVAFKTGLDYLRKKPEYYNPLKESLIHLHKSLKLLPLKTKKGPLVDIDFTSAINEIKAKDEVKLAVEKFLSNDDSVTADTLEVKLAQMETEIKNLTTR